MPAKRGLSGGVIAIGVINIILALFLTCGGVFGLIGLIAPSAVFSTFMPGFEPPSQPQAILAVGLVNAVITLLCCLMFGIGAIGLFSRAGWARKMSIFAAGLYAFATVVSLVIFMATPIKTIHEQYQEDLQEAIQEYSVQQGRPVQQDNPAAAIGEQAGQFGGLCCGLPLVAYAIVSIFVLSSPGVKRQFDPTEDEFEQPSAPDDYSNF